jgi:predicted ATPase/transcriptional regulator with XRE-family HTH domain
MSTSLPFGVWLKQRRKTLELTQHDLADRVGCSIAMVRKVETGERRPSPELARRFAAALAIPSSERELFLEAALGHETAYQKFLATRTNLPQQSGLLIGRDKEFKELVRWIGSGSHRLLTLVGPGGIGKTKLAIDVASTCINSFENGVFFVPLAAVSDPLQVPIAVADVLGLAVVPRQSNLDDFWSALRELHMLLIFDNFEQVISAAPFVAELHRHCPWITTIVTSREGLYIRDEKRMLIPALAMPPPTNLDVGTALTYSAVSLFVDRARASHPEFQLNEENVNAVGAICVELDGLPLAIELIASHINALSPQALLGRLSNRLLLLQNGARDLPARHQTLRAAIAWSFDRLSPDEQRLFVYMGIFVDGWTLEAIEFLEQNLDHPPPSPGASTQQELARSRVAILLAHQSLIAKSMIMRQDPAQDDDRFTMLQTIREYALERLPEYADQDQLRYLHAHYFLTIAQSLRQQSVTPPDSRSSDRISREINNIRAALHWALHHNHVDMAFELAEVLWFFHLSVADHLAHARAINTELEHLVAERTASLQNALDLIQEREANLQLINEELLQAKITAERNSAVKTQFISGISHEFHTVLNVIINFSQFLGDPMYGELTREQQSFQHRLLANTEYLLGLVHEMLDLAKLEINYVDSVFTLVDIRHFLDEIIEAAKRFTNHPDFIFNLDISPNAFAIYADRTRLRQVVLTIVLNAMLRSSGNPITIKVTFPSVDWVCIAVIDSGPQIDPLYLPAILDDSGLLDDSNPYQYHRLAQRLYVSRQITARLGGTLSIANQQHGVICSVLLPTTPLPPHQ